MTKRPVHSSSLLAGAPILTFNASLGLWRQNQTSPMSCAKTCGGRGGDFRLLCTSFLPFWKKKSNNTCNDLAASRFFFFLSFNLNWWFLKTCDKMFLEWKDKSWPPLCWELIFQLCDTGIALGWIRYSMALVWKTQRARNGQCCTDTRPAYRNAVWSSRVRCTFTAALRWKNSEDRACVANRWMIKTAWLEV